MFADVGAFPWWFRWSPDAKVLRFTKNEISGNGQWEVSADGANLHRLFTGRYEHLEQRTGNWTPDGRYFVFAMPAGIRYDLWAVREKHDWLHKIDNNPVQLTSGPMSFNAPQPSSDGTKIFAVGAQFRAELSRYDAKAGQFVPHLGGISAVGATFSPDGQWIAYFTVPEGQLWRSRVDGSEKLPLTSPQTFSPFARWSPDGQQIAYVSARTGEADQLCLVGRDGASPRVLYQSRGGVIRPSWRKDGSAILFHEASPLTTAEEEEVKVLDLKTGQVSTLPGSKGMILPITSPDGRFLASGTTDGKKLKLYDFSTQAWQEFAPQFWRRIRRVVGRQPLCLFRQCLECRTGHLSFACCRSEAGKGRKSQRLPACNVGPSSLVGPYAQRRTTSHAGHRLARGVRTRFPRTVSRKMTIAP